MNVVTPAQGGADSGVCAGVGCATLDFAISVAHDGDTIAIGSGVFTSSVPLTVNKSLTIQGVSRALTTLEPGFSVTNRDDAWISVADGKTVTFQDLAVDGLADAASPLTSHAIGIGIRFLGSSHGTIQHVDFRNIAFGQYYGIAVATNKGGTPDPATVQLDVSNSSFSSIGRVGVLYKGAGVTGTFSGNTYTGKGPGDHIDYALDISAGADVTVTGNTITNNQGIASTDGSGSGGLTITDYWGPGTAAAIDGNTFTNNLSGIGTGFLPTDASATTITNNTFTDNDVAIESVQTAPLPVGTGNTFTGGRKASGNVTSVGPDTLYVATDGDDQGGASYCGDESAPCATVQQAVDGARDGDTVSLAAGEYTQPVVVNGKKVTVAGAGASRDDVTLKSPAPGTLAPCVQHATDGYTNDPAVVCAKDDADLTLRNLTVSGDNGVSAVTGVGFYNANGTVDAIKTEATRDFPLAGNQRGRGIDAQSTGGAHTVVVQHSLVTDFQKHGIRGWGPGLTMNTTDNTVECAGAIPQLAQNGIQLRGGATGTISGNTVSGCGYTGNDTATALMLYAPGTGVVVDDNQVSGSDQGVYLGPNTAPTAPGDVAITNNTFTDNQVGVYGDLSAPFVLDSSNDFSGAGREGYGAVTGVGPATLYVGPAGNDQADANLCGLESTPCLTVQHAVDVARDGDTVSLADGTYEEAVVVDGKQVSIVGAGAARDDVTLKAPATTPVCGNGVSETLHAVVCAKGGAELNLSNVKVDGAEKAGSPNNVFGGVVYIDSDGTVDGIETTRTRSPYTAPSAVPPTLSGAQTGRGIDLFAGSGTHNVTVKNSTLADFQKQGIRAGGAALNVEIDHNTITCGGDQPVNSPDGIRIEGGAQFQITGNTISDCVWTAYETSNQPYWGASAILLKGSSGTGNTIIGNTVTGTTYGVLACPQDCSVTTPPTLTGDVTVEDNTFDTEDTAVKVYGGSAPFTLGSNDYGNSPNTVDGLPVLQLGSASLSFTAPAGAWSARQKVTLTAVGAPVDVTRVTITGANPAVFDLNATDCNRSTLAVGDSCDVWIAALSDTEGSYSATVAASSSTAGLTVIDPAGELSSGAALAATIDGDLKGDQGNPGATGTPGANGADGATGAQGDKGDQGDAGAPGAPGDQGAIGPQGVPGAIGAPGPIGQAGVKGDKGDVGKDGKPGPVVIIDRKVRANSRGRARVATLVCTTGTCRVSGKKATIKIGRKTYRVKFTARKRLKAGSTGSVQAVLTSSARRALAHHSGLFRVKLKITSSNGSSLTRTIKSRVSKSRASAR